MAAGNQLRVNEYKNSMSREGLEKFDVPGRESSGILTGNPRRN